MSNKALQAEGNVLEVFFLTLISTVSFKCVQNVRCEDLTKNEHSFGLRCDVKMQCAKFAK